MTMPSDNSRNSIINFKFCALLSALLIITGAGNLLHLAGFDASGQGNLLITPRRVIFEGAKRSVDLNLANIGQDSATYAISMVQIRMKQDGGFETITEPDPGQNFADKNIRFFPRSVTLAPNEAQVVKIQLIKADQLLPGEYRSHFYFRSVPISKPLGEENAAKDSSSISIKLTPIFGITIPVIIRMGEYDAGVTLSEISLSDENDTIPAISMMLNRSGGMSVYGDIVVDYISAQGKTTRVGIANGVAVYTPNVSRRFKFNLNKVKDIDYSSGKLKVTYTNSSDTKQAKYTETELILHK
jgi:hypothetical protein